jgi:hypothetical protein
LEASLGYIASLIKAKTKQQKILFQTPSFAWQGDSVKETWWWIGSVCQILTRC